MIPQISGVTIDQVEIVPYPSRTFRLTEKQITGNIDGAEAIKQAVYHILSTERYAYAIYDDNFGVEFEKYKGRGFDYLEATIENTLNDALLQDDRIIKVNVANIVKTNKNTALIEITVDHNQGTFSEEVVINV